VVTGTTPIKGTARPPDRPESSRGFVSLLDVDPDLAAGIPAEDQPLARRALARTVHRLPEEGFDAGALLRGEGAFGLLIVEGAVVRVLDLGGRVCDGVLGPGDVIGAGGTDAQFPATWKVLRAAAVVVLDARFTTAAQRWPSLAVNLHRRLLEQDHRTAVNAAIAQLPRVERRVVALLWQLAERFGRVTPFGVEIELSLTHEALGRLVGAQRPTVSLALADLAREGAVTRTVRRTWLLANDSRDLLGPAGGAGEAGATAPIA
jgi:CRP/FNR family transcriptional regulator, cyclic AMP receptor protein